MTDSEQVVDKNCQFKIIKKLKLKFSLYIYMYMYI